MEKRHSFSSEDNDKMVVMFLHENRTCSLDMLGEKEQYFAYQVFFYVEVVEKCK